MSSPYGSMAIFVWCMMNKWVDGCGQAIGYAIIALAILSFILKNCGGW